MKWRFLLVNLLLLAYVNSNDLDDEATVSDFDDELEQPSNTVEDEIQYKSPASTNRHYFSEHFDDRSSFAKRWIKSEAMKDGIDADIAKYDGEWSVEAAHRDGLTGDLGLVLKSKAKHAAISARLYRPFVFSDKPFIVQYEVTLQDGQECGGAYIKLLAAGNDLTKFQDKTPYSIMFGPDKCGNDHKLHFIFKHRNPKNGTYEEKHCKKPTERLEDPFKDKLPHLYTLVIRPDNTFEIRLDHKVINRGSLLEDFTPAVNPPAEIDDPNDKKPENWDEREKIPDPESIKPEDWDEDAPAQIPDTEALKPDGWMDNEPELIPDLESTKPADWDTEMDGEWEPPMIANPICTDAPGCGPWSPPMVNNPEYKGKWRPPMIDNPNYKGKWRPRRIPNPDFFEDKHPFRMSTIDAIGFELWSMSKDILFDNIIITDDMAAAIQWASETFDLKRKKIDKDAESLWTRIVRFTNDNPWIWAVYVLVIGLPIVLIVFMCCTTTTASREKEELRRAAEAKKTDAVSSDDPHIETEDVKESNAVPEKDVQEEPTEEVEEEKEVELISDENVEETQEEEKEQLNDEIAAGDAPRKRRPRKD